MSLQNPSIEQVNEILLFLRKRRIEKEISQYEMAFKLCVSQNTYFKIEKGKTKLDMLRFLQICHILELDALEVIKATKKVYLPNYNKE